jgi:hypothetical protein
VKDSPGVALPFAAAGRHTAWSRDRIQENTCELNRYVLSADGTLDGSSATTSTGTSPTPGEVDNQNTEYLVDGFRYARPDAVRDTAGVFGTLGYRGRDY